MAAALSVVLSSSVHAGPADGIVTAGQATISAGASQTTIDQSTDRAIINWKNFDVGLNESVLFNTPGSHAATLNRITSGDPSQILGSVTSNGQLWLINPSGILFGPHAQVNVAGLLASTLDISDAGFLSGDYRFNQSGASPASIVNHGHLSANNGYVALLAPQIQNTGFVSAKLGTVALGAGTKATLELQGNKLLRFQIDEGAEVPLYDSNGQPIAALSQSGTVAADGGQVLLVAKSIDSLLNQSINVSGVVRADSVSEVNGKIILSASGNIILDNADVSAQGLAAGETGGAVEVIGKNVALINGTSVDVSGKAGGGDMRIGYDNRNPGGPEAEITVAGPGSQLKADATETGDGGLVETSGKYLDVFGAAVSAKGAINGAAGTWLLDPRNVTIGNNTTSGGSFAGGAFTPVSDDSIVDVNDIVSLLTAGTSVTITTGSGGTQNGDITLANALTAGTGSSATQLTLNAAGNIAIDAPLSTLGSLTLQAAGNVTQSDAITTAGENVTINAGGDFSQSASGSIVTGSGSTWGDVTIHAGTGATGIAGSVTLAGLVEGNAVSIDSGANSTGNITQSGSLISHDTGITGISIANYGAGDILQTSTGTMTLVFAGAPTTDLGIALAALNGNIQQAGAIDAKQSLATLKSENGSFITQDDGAGHLGSITSGSTLLLGQNGVQANLSGNNSLGSLSGVSLGDLSVNDIGTNGLVLGPVSSGALTISASGAIRQSDTITADGDVSLTGATIVTGADLDAGTHTVNLTATDVNITAGNAAINLDDGTLTAGDLNITSASGSILEGFGLIHSSGTMTIAASDGAADGGNSVDLSQNPGNLLGTANITSARDVNLAAMNGYAISGINSTGDITARTNYGVNGPVTGTLTVNGAVTTTKTAGTISLSNDRTTALYGVQITAAGSVAAAGDITVAAASSEAGVNNNGIDIAGNIASGSGGIYIYANRNYGLGPSDLYAANMNIGGSISTTSGYVYLEDFGAGTITIADGADLNGGNSTALTIQSDNGSIAQTGGAISGAAGLNVTAAGSITQTGNGVMSSTANTTLAAGSTSDITLNNAGNNFGTVGITSGNNVALTDADGIILDTSTAGTLTVTSAGPMVLTGDITASSIFLTATDTTSGYIQQTTGTITTTNAASFEAYGARMVSNPPYPDAYLGIDLLQNYSSSNQFTELSMISHYSGASAQANGMGSTGVSGSTNDGLFNTQIINGTLTVDSAGVASGTGSTLLSINGTGNIAVNADVASGALSLSANGGTITQQAGTTLSGSVSMSNASAATLNNAGALELGSVNVTNLSVTASDDITQSDALTVSGTTALDAGTHAIALTDAGNTFGDTVTIGHTGVTAGAVALTSGGGNLTVSMADGAANTKLSSLNLSAAGAIAQVGPLVVTGASAFTAVGHDISVAGPNHLTGAVTLNGNNIDVGNIDALQLGAVTATGDFSVTVFGDLSQTTGTVLTVAGATDINAQSNDVVLTNNNVFSGAVSLTGNNLSLVQAAGNDLTLASLDAYGDVSVQDSGGTLTFAGSSPAITLRNGVSNSTITLVSSQFSNQNTGSDSPIDLGTGTDNVWHFYLGNLDGNTFSSGSNTLISGHQAIWGASYPTAIAQTGNRYIFATSQILTLSPVSGALNLTAIEGTGTSLAAPTAGANYAVSGFVNAGNYGNVFTQDTAANVLDGTLTFGSAGSAASAGVGTYDITMTAPASSATGYSLVTSNSYGTIAVTALPPPDPDPGPGDGEGSIPDSLRTVGTLLNVDPAVSQKNVEGGLPSLDASGRPAGVPERETIEEQSSGINSQLKQQ